LKSEPYNEMVDLWSVGVILYILLCGFPPFYNDNQTALLRQIKQGKYSFPDPYWKNISEQAKDLVRGLLTVDPKLRLTCEKTLKHPWIAGEVSDAAFDKSHAQRLQMLQARAKLRRGVQSIIAVNRFARGLGNWIQVSDDPTGSTKLVQALSSLRASSLAKLTSTPSGERTEASSASSSSSSSSSSGEQKNKEPEGEEEDGKEEEEEEEDADESGGKKTKGGKAKAKPKGKAAARKGKQAKADSNGASLTLPKESPVGSRTRSNLRRKANPASSSAASSSSSSSSDAMPPPNGSHDTAKTRKAKKAKKEDADDDEL